MNILYHIEQIHVILYYHRFYRYFISHKTDTYDTIIHLMLGHNVVAAPKCCMSTFATFLKSKLFDIQCFVVYERLTMSYKNFFSIIDTEFYSFIYRILKLGKMAFLKSKER